MPDVSITDEDVELEHHAVTRYLIVAIVIMKQW